MLKNNSRYYLTKNQALPFVFYNKVLPEMPEKLSDLIQRRMKDVGIPTKAELARQLGISSAYAGDLANGTGKTKDGSYMPSPELVAKLVKVLQVSENEILNAIGYATDSSNYIETTELDENVRVQLLGAKHFSDEDKREFIEAFQVAYEVAKRRIAEKKKQA